MHLTRRSSPQRCFFPWVFLLLFSYPPRPATDWQHGAATALPTADLQPGRRYMVALVAKFRVKMKMGPGVLITLAAVLGADGQRTGGLLASQGAVAPQTGPTLTCRSASK